MDYVQMRRSVSLKGDGAEEMKNPAGGGVGRGEVSSRTLSRKF